MCDKPLLRLEEMDAPWLDETPGLTTEYAVKTTNNTWNK